MTIGYDVDQSLPCIAGEEISRGMVLKVDGTTLKKCGSADKPVGIAENDAKIGQTVAVLKSGDHAVLVKANEGLTIGDNLIVNASGNVKVDNAMAEKWCIGTALIDNSGMTGTTDPFLTQIRINIFYSNKNGA